MNRRNFWRSANFLVATTIFLLGWLITGCRQNVVLESGVAPTVSPLMGSRETEDESGMDSTDAPDPVPTLQDKSALSDSQVNELENFQVAVDVNKDVHPISPLIYGLSGGFKEHEEQLRFTLNSWGGNPSTRFNWQLGNAWNAGSDWYYINGNYGYTGQSASDDFISDANQAGIAVRLAIPTLGWVAKNDDNNTCSFPMPDGTCGDADGANCQNPGEIADPTLANVPSDPEFIRGWLEHLFLEKEFDIRFIAMDNEPMLWGSTHYDVHPDCTTYEEVLEKFLTYAEVVREVAPEVEITGPNSCCWYYYWNSAAGQGDVLRHKNQPFLAWFLEQVREHDQVTGQRTLDVLDIHYYPDGLYNNVVDEETASHRLRSTRSLWDPQYLDESWIDEPVELIPKMKGLIDRFYPGTKLGISEWNWGADGTMNGALAIADVLGIFGREELYFAAYWREPPINSPGFYAFKMFTNVDNEGQRFGDTSVWSETTNYDQVSSYAALDSETGNLHLMLVNKVPEDSFPIEVNLNGLEIKPDVTLHQYSENNLTDIVKDALEVSQTGNFTLSLPPNSITLLIITPNS